MKIKHYCKIRIFLNILLFIFLLTYDLEGAFNHLATESIFSKIEQSRLSFLGIHENFTISDVGDGQKTLNIIELWELTLPDEILNMLLTLSREDNPVLEAVTEKDISNCTSSNGTEIYPSILPRISSFSFKDRDVIEEIQNEEEIIVSCSCSVQIKININGQTKYFLLKTKRSLLLPVGGKYEIADVDIFKRFQARPVREDKPKDIRVYVPTDKVNLFRKWFFSKVGRETDPSREIYEELVEEAKCLSQEIGKALLDVICKVNVTSLLQNDASLYNSV